VSQWTTPQAQVARTIWPTPTASDMKASGSRNTVNSKAHPGVSLTDAVNRDDGSGRRDRMKISTNGKSPVWSTPRSQDEYERRNQKTQDRIMLEGGDRTLPTQVEFMGREQTGYCGRLNHRWVAQLMGFHPQWCDVNPDCDDTP